MKNLKERGEKVLAPVLGKYFDDFEVKEGKGCYLFDADGKKYLDFSSGIATCVLGHCPPAVAAAAKMQSSKLIHICIGVAYYEPYIELAEELQKISPMKNAQVFLCQSGAEAVEAAVKLAKYTTKKAGIIAFQGGFHGRTLGALSITTSKMKYREGYEPLLPQVYIAPADLRVVEGIMESHPGKIAGAVIEPLLGEGGYIAFEKKFLRGLRRLCDKYNVLLIFDEVQTGMGHTGKWFAGEHAGVTPDIVTLAKGLASGFPLGACVAKKEVMSRWSPGAHGSTFGGNPVSCAAALATLRVIKKKNLLAHAAKLGKSVQNHWPALPRTY
ncbi:aminotransferase class III-fold pyridoxal phosphate-dependent enzyme, partial [Candidatus Saganbacteria bacterium]|nr:aminotransferase class III-fold pyridoxal phosphate-dependent enzyme [Candidatus Saganbacteria bacterium]